MGRVADLVAKIALLGVGVLIGTLIFCLKVGAIDDKGVMSVGVDSPSVVASGVSSMVRFEGGAEDFVFLPERLSEDSAGDVLKDDLFLDLKGLMPGDSRKQSIKVKNTAQDYDYVRIYLRAEPHEVEENLPEILKGEYEYEKGEGMDEELLKERMEEYIAGMRDFLAQLKMTVKNGGKVISTTSGETMGLTKNVLLGTLRKGEEVELEVEVAMPLELDNRYAYRAGEIDWVFTAEMDTGEMAVIEYENDWFWLIVAITSGVLATGCGIWLGFIRRRRREER